MVFALVAISVVALLSWVSYGQVRGALEDAFEGRLLGIADAVASQVAPEDVADVRRLGFDGTGYATLQLQLEELRTTAGIAAAAVVDTARRVLYDTRGEDRSLQPAAWDTAASGSLTRALAGKAAISLMFLGTDAPRRAGFAPVLDDRGRTVAVVAIEARVDYLPVLSDFGRSLVLTTALIALALAGFGALLVRGAWSAARLERRLSRAENLAAMGRLTATLAHEIKNPLAVIRGSASRLGKLAPEADRMSQFIVEESDRLSRTVARYLAFARGGEDAPGEPADALEALRSTLELLEGEMKERRVTLDLAAGGPEHARVRLDRESLKQVYLNLVLNAMEAMPEGGTLSVRRAEHGTKVEIAFSDTGAGIPAEVVARLGNPFFSTKAQGTGLGLFLTRRLLEAGGGELAIDSATGRGTTCTVRLPRLAERGKA